MALVAILAAGWRARASYWTNIGRDKAENVSWIAFMRALSVGSTLLASVPV